jgi:hypothetical protein
VRPQHRDRIRLLRDVRVVLAQYLVCLARLNQARDRSYGHPGARNDWLASHHGRIALHVAVAQTSPKAGQLAGISEVGETCLCANHALMAAPAISVS